jgi:hypothetical protein
MLNTITRKFFDPYPESSFGCFRICFYLTILTFYSLVHDIVPYGFQTHIFKSFYDPVSFFKFIPYDFLFAIDFKILDLIWKISLLFAAAGFLYPLSSGFSFLIFLWMAGIPLNFGKIHHSQHMVVVVLGILFVGLLPGKFSFDSVIFRKFRRFYNPIATINWPLDTIKVYIVLVYFASGFQKLRHSGVDWIFSDNMSIIILTRPTMTELGFFVSQFKILTVFLAFLTVFFQLFAPLSLLSRKFAFFCTPTLFLLHVGTYSVLGNHGNFFPYNLCFLAWIPWDRLRIASLSSFVNKMFSRIHSHF